MFPEGEPEEILKAAFGTNGPGHLTLRGGDKKRLVDEQRMFYGQIGIGKGMVLSYCAGLDRIAHFLSMATAMALGARISALESSSPRSVWKAIGNSIEAELLDLHLRELQIDCERVYSRYHRTQKGAADEVLARYPPPQAEDDFLKLGGVFEQVFGPTDNLFLTREDYGKHEKFGYVPKIREDEKAGALIEKYEYLVSTQQVITNSKVVLAVEKAYWEQGKQDKFRDLLDSAIYAAKLESRVEDQFRLTVRFAERLEEANELEAAERQWSEALKITERFSTEDRRYAKTQHQLIRCTILNDADVLTHSEEWGGKLRKCYDILDELYGDFKTKLDVKATMVLLGTKLGDYDQVIVWIDEERGEIDPDFHPRSEADFLYGCANSILNEWGSNESQYARDLKEYATVLLNDAKKIQEKFGEHSRLIRSLELEADYAANDYTKNVISANIKLLKARLEQVEVMIDKGEEDVEFIQHLCESNCQEGLRKLIENSYHLEELDKQRIYEFAGKYGAFWQIFDRAQIHCFSNPKSAREEITLAKMALESIDSSFLRARLLEVEAKIPGSEGSRIELCRQLIDRWGELKSPRGVHRWKNNLADELMGMAQSKYARSEVQEEKSRETRKEGAAEARRLGDEVVEFYRGKDAANYYFFSAGRITRVYRTTRPWRDEKEGKNWRRPVNNMNIIWEPEALIEWQQLLEDTEVPQAAHIQIQLRCKFAAAVTQTPEPDMKKALEIIKPATMLIDEEGNIDESRRRWYDTIQRHEITWLARYGKFTQAYDKLQEMVGKGLISKSDEMWLRYQLLCEDGKHEEAVENLEQKFQHEVENGELKLASLTLRGIGWIYNGLREDQTDDGKWAQLQIEVLKRKYWFDTKTAKDVVSRHTGISSLRVLCDIHKDMKEYREAKAILWEMFRITENNKWYHGGFGRGSQGLLWEIIRMNLEMGEIKSRDTASLLLQFWEKFVFENPSGPSYRIRSDPDMNLKPVSSEDVWDQFSKYHKLLCHPSERSEAGFWETKAKLENQDEVGKLLWAMFNFSVQNKLGKKALTSINLIISHKFATNSSPDGAFRLKKKVLPRLRKKWDEEE